MAKSQDDIIAEQSAINWLLASRENYDKFWVHALKHIIHTQDFADALSNSDKGDLTSRQVWEQFQTDVTQHPTLNQSNENVKFLLTYIEKILITHPTEIPKLSKIREKIAELKTTQQTLVSLTIELQKRLLCTPIDSTINDLIQLSIDHYRRYATQTNFKKGLIKTARKFSWVTNVNRYGSIKKCEKGVAEIEKHIGTNTSVEFSRSVDNMIASSLLFVAALQARLEGRLANFLETIGIDIDHSQKPQRPPTDSSPTPPCKATVTPPHTPTAPSTAPSSPIHPPRRPPPSNTFRLPQQTSKPTLLPTTISYRYPGLIKYRQPLWGSVLLSSTALLVLHLFGILPLSIAIIGVVVPLEAISASILILTLTTPLKLSITSFSTAEQANAIRPANSEHCSPPIHPPKTLHPPPAP